MKRTLRNVMTIFLLLVSILCLSSCKNKNNHEKFEIVYSEILNLELYKFNNHYYYVSKEVALDWYDAESICESLGGHLVAITSSAENDFLTSIINKESKYYAGFYLKDDKWRWVIDEGLGYSNWASGEPNNQNGIEDKLEIYYSSASHLVWNDISPKSPRSYIIEWEKESDIGEKKEYYKKTIITTIDELNKIQSKQDYFCLGADIDLGGDVWNPIEFAGVLNGNGHSISNYILNANTDYLGFFSTLTGRVSNVNFENVTVMGKPSKNYVAAIAGKNEGAISDCTVSGKVSASSSEYVGAIAGSSSGPIVNCDNSAEVSGNNYVGGIVGYSTAEIKTVSNSGSVNGDSSIGGIVGYQEEDDLYECNNKATVTATGINCGGIVGYYQQMYASSSVCSCNNTGVIKGQDKTAGLFGCISHKDSDYITIISNSSNVADITGSNYVGSVVGYSSATLIIDGIDNNNAIVGKAYIGGILGQGTNATIMNCNNYGQIVSNGTVVVDNTSCSYVGGIAGECNKLQNCKNDVDIKGTGAFVGGIAGKSKGIDICTNTAEVLAGGAYSGGISAYNVGYVSYATNSGSVSGTYSVGGIVGYQENGDLNECNNSGVVVGSGSHCGGITGYYQQMYSSTNIYYCTNSAAIKGQNNVGGLFGYVNYKDFDYNTTLSNSSNTADITGSNAVGGIAGFCSAQFIFDGINNNNIIVGKAYVGGIVGQGTGAKIKNCNNYGQIVSNGTVVVDNNTSCSYVGGIAGECASLTNCNNGVDITGTGDYVGGLAGASTGISNCTNTGEITAGGSYAGGISGYNTGKVAIATNTGTINGTWSVAGIVGCQQGGDLSDCTNSGVIIGSGNNVGGIIGYYQQLYVSTNIYSCNNTAEVTGQEKTGGLFGSISHKDFDYTTTISNSSNVADITGSNYVGGVVGYCSAQVIVDGIDNNNTIIGKAYVGGIIGQGANTIIKNCNNYGMIEANGTVVESNVSCTVVGGIAGQCSSLHNCRNEVNITATGAYVGGIAGKSEGVSNCTNIGDITATGAYVGGIVGCNTGDVSNATNTGFVIGASSVGGIVGYQQGGNYSDCSNTGAITAIGNNCGGIVGYYYQRYSSTNIYTCNNSSEVKGQEYVGGLLGYMNFKDSDYSTTISNSTNELPVSGNNYLGDIVGYTTAKTIYNGTTYRDQTINNN